MKKLLSLLMCYVLLQAETFALRGGPTGKTNSPLSGSFSALLIQTSPLFNINNVQVGTEPGNGLGMVLLNVPASGPATGSLLVFDAQTGDTFLGKSNGLSDPRSGTLISLVSATQFLIQATNLQGVSTGTTVATRSETISGIMLAKNQVANRGLTVPQITGSANLLTANIPFIDLNTGRTFIGNGAPTTYELVGYQSAQGGGILGGFSLTDSTL